MHICACVRSSSVGCVIRVPLLDLAYTYLLTYLLDLACILVFKWLFSPEKAYFLIESTNPRLAGPRESRVATYLL